MRGVHTSLARDVAAVGEVVWGPSGWSVDTGLIPDADGNLRPDLDRNPMPETYEVLAALLRWLDARPRDRTGCEEAVLTQRQAIRDHVWSLYSEALNAASEAELSDVKEDPTARAPLTFHVIPARMENALRAVTDLLPCLGDASINAGILIIPIIPTFKEQ